MENYQTSRPLKIRLLDVVRRLFTIPVLENFLAKKTRSGVHFYKKFIPPPYLYKTGSKRKSAWNGITYNLDISHLNDNYLYFGISDAHIDEMNHYAKNAKVIFDVGGNIGVVSLGFAKLNPTASIWTFEPDPKNFARAKEHIELNGIKNIQLVNIGLGSEPAVLKLYEVNKNNPGMNRISNVELDVPYKEVQIDSIDRFVRANGIGQVDLIKIDVEGFEFPVLQGAIETLKTKPVLYIEIIDENLKANGSSAKEVINFLIGIGYTHITRTDTMQLIEANTNLEGCEIDILAK